MLMLTSAVETGQMSAVRTRRLPPSSHALASSLGREPGRRGQAPALPVAHREICTHSGL